MKVGVLALQGDVREHVRALESAGATAILVKKVADLDEIQGLVLPGGESTTIGKLLDRFGILEPLRAKVEDGLPVFGTCAGLILMASEVVGAQDAPHRLGTLDVSVQRNAYGRQVDSFETDLDVRSLGEVRGVFIRAPAIDRIGPGVEVLASYGGSPVLVRQGAQLAASFHPEMAGEDRVHRSFLESLG
jgi:5'-phosphate synthase pdxT subunit